MIPILFSLLFTCRFCFKAGRYLRKCYFKKIFLSKEARSGFLTRSISLLLSVVGIYPQFRALRWVEAQYVQPLEQWLPELSAWATVGCLVIGGRITKPPRSFTWSSRSRRASCSSSARPSSSTWSLVQGRVTNQRRWSISPPWHLTLLCPLKSSISPCCLHPSSPCAPALPG